jgi:MoaA/NifB/PqqE/SkfB family radical SAM enzyme
VEEDDRRIVNLVNPSLLKDIIGIVYGIITTFFALLQVTKQFLPKELFIILLIALSLLSSIFLITKIIVKIKSLKQFEFYPSRNVFPDKYSIESILKKILKKRHRVNVTVIGRNNSKWFDNKLLPYYNNDLLEYCTFRFVIQYVFVKNENVDENINKIIDEEYKNVTEAYGKIYSSLSDDNKKYFSLYLTSKKIENSMTYITYDIKNEEMWYDLTQELVIRPVILFKNKYIPDDLKNRIKNIINNKNCKDWFKYVEECESAKEETNNLINEFTFTDKDQRGNESYKWASVYFNFREKLKENRHFVPPITVQTLITNKCTSNCVMCDHYTISNNRSMSQDELLNVYDYINNIGVKNVIISGGEPLAEEFCLKLIEEIYGKYKFNIGLLTNGIKKNGIPIDLNDALVLKEKCKWVQVSVDSFSDNIYESIRGGNSLNIVKESINNLERVDLNYEICYTIQKKNIDEAFEIFFGEMPFALKNKRVRFKFAHLISRDIDMCDFIIGNGSKNKEKISNLFNRSINTGWNNISFLREMFLKKYYNFDDVLAGTPVSSKLGEFNSSNYRCFIPYFICKIDAEANVYPCCFLCDDNSGNDSKVRKDSLLGSLRDNNFGKVQGLVVNNEKSNKLREILETNFQGIKYYKIPVNDFACKNCTRYVLQNAFFNKIDKIYDKYKNIGYPNFINNDGLNKISDLFF